jgi:hypothetical protein
MRGTHIHHRNAKLNAINSTNHEKSQSEVTFLFLAIMSLASNNRDSNCSLTALDIEQAVDNEAGTERENDANKDSPFSNNIVERLRNFSIASENLVKYVGIEGDSEELNRQCSDGSEEYTRPRAYTFTPRIPTNSPVILSWQNLSVTTLTAKPKVLLDNISGSITGGFWAIMGASGGGKIPFTPSYFKIITLPTCFR